MRKFLLPFLAAVLCATPASATVNITACGQAVPDKETGILQNNLSCPGGALPTDPPAVLMGKSSTLQMNGHKITGGGCAITQGPVIPRSTRVTIQGPGEIANSHDGICFGRGRLTLSDLNIHNVSEGVHGSDAPGSGCVVAATNVMVTSNETGIHAFSVIANAVTATGNSFAGIWTFNLNGDGLTANTNGTGILAHGSVRLKDSSTVNNNAGMGIDSRTAALRDSTITGNNGEGVGIDIGTANRPGVKNVVCGRSWKRGVSLALNWGICTND
jgi:hypothetical protein